MHTVRITASTPRGVFSGLYNPDGMTESEAEEVFYEMAEDMSSYSNIPLYQDDGSVVVLVEAVIAESVFQLEVVELK